MRKVGDAVNATDSTLGITCGLVSEFLWGVAASAAKAFQRVAEHRIARRADEFIDLDEFIATASPDELAAMALAEQRSEPPNLLAATPGESPLMGLVDAEVHCPDCNCPTVCGCGREIYADDVRYSRGLPMWFHRDDDSPITQRCADIRDGLADAPVSHADLAERITKVWVGGTHIGYTWADPIAGSLLAYYRITKK